MDGTRFTLAVVLWAALLLARSPRATAQDYTLDGMAADVDPPGGIVEASHADVPLVSGRRRLFFDDFSAARLDRSKWSGQRGVRVLRDLPARAGDPTAARLGAATHGHLRPALLTSVPIALGGARNVHLAYTLMHRGADAGESLAVEILDPAGRWQLIERTTSDGRDSAAFARHRVPLPARLLHNNLRIRFRADVDDPDDTWLVGAVMLCGDPPGIPLTVRLRPVRGETVIVIDPDTGRRSDALAPFTRTLPPQTQVYLVAPPSVDGWVFSHWTVDGLRRADRRRGLLLAVERRTEAVAVYRTAISGRLPAVVTIGSIPVSGVPVHIGLGQDPPCLTPDPDGGLACLTGEELVLEAPARTPRLAFLGWVINGTLRKTDRPVLRRRIEEGDVIFAEYVRLGDMNGDDQLDKFDVDAFLAALVDPDGYARKYPDLDPVLRGDVNGDGMLDVLDVERFVDLILNE